MKEEENIALNPLPVGVIILEPTKKAKRRQQDSTFSTEIFCHCLPVILTLTALGFIYAFYRDFSQSDTTTLVKVFVCFRHGKKVAYWSYKDDKYSPYNRTIWNASIGELTERGKWESYELGKRLKERYGEFLGDVYNPGEVRAYSTPVRRAKVTGQLVMSALFQTTDYQEAKEQLTWNAIPLEADYIYNISIGSKCPAFSVELEKAYKLLLNYSLSEEEMKVINVLEKYAVAPNEIPSSIIVPCYEALNSQSYEGLPLPEWSKDIYPREITAVSLAMMTKYVNGTELLKKLLLYNYSVAVRNFLLSDDDIKLEIHSWHDINQLAIIHSFGLTFDDYPKPTSCIAIEMHMRNDQQVFEVYFYDSYRTIAPQQMETSCGKSCSVSDLEQIVNCYRLKNYTEVCQKGQPNRFTPITKTMYL